MATIYFTNEFNSGEGSLRQAISDASSGDTIMPDEDAFADVDEIVIYSEASLTISKSLAIDGGSRRIRFDSQENPNYIRCGTANTSATFVNFELIRVKLTNAYGALFVGNGAEVTLDRCRIAGNYTRGGAIYCDASSTVRLNDSVVVGNFASSSGSGVYASGSVYIKGSTIVSEIFASADGVLKEIDNSIVCSVNKVIGALGGGNVASVAISNIGFVVAPPSSVSANDWDAYAWESYDLRLSYDSNYLATAVNESGAIDLLGHARKPTGASGAIEGAWLVVAADQEAEIDANATVDYAELYGGVSFDGTDVVLAVTQEAAVGAASFQATSGSSGYAAFPVGTDTASAAFVGVKSCEYGANLESFDVCLSGGSTARFHAAQTGAASFLIERYDETTSSWETVDAAATEETTTAVIRYQDAYFRAFDGAAFLYSTLTRSSFGEFWRVDGWAVAQAGGESPTGTGKSWTVNLWAISPNIKED